MTKNTEEYFVIMSSFFKNLFYDHITLRICNSSTTFINISINKITFLFFNILLTLFVVLGNISLFVYYDHHQENKRIKNEIEIRTNDINEVVNNINEIYQMKSIISNQTNKMLEAMSGNRIESVYDKSLQNVLILSANAWQNDKLKLLPQIPHSNPTTGVYTSGFRIRVNPFADSLQFHRGIDFGNKIGTNIFATHSGTVIYAGYENRKYYGFGNVVVVKNDLYTTTYAHLDQILVMAGQNITTGMIIGKMGNTGKSTGPHLHYEIKLNKPGIFTNPKDYVLCKRNTNCKRTLKVSRQPI